MIREEKNAEIMLVGETLEAIRSDLLQAKKHGLFDSFLAVSVLHL